MIRIQNLTKNVGKSILYQLWTPRVAVPFRLGYVFHTEAVFDRGSFEKLLKFCKGYFDIVGKKAICTLMSPRALRVARQLKSLGLKESDYTARAHQLSEVSTLGYHGHYWVNPSGADEIINQMKCENFVLDSYSEQLSQDLEWFASEGVEHHGIYSAGWWVMCEPIVRTLIKNGFKLDFSFSKSKWFNNQYSMDLMDQNGIASGEPFFIESQKEKMLMIQNFVGCHNTPFPQDFIRNMNKLFKSDGDRQHERLGVTNSHDYDLNFDYTLNCLRWLKEEERVGFYSAQDFRDLTNHSFKSVQPALTVPGAGPSK